jgi:hypothetical protein
MKDISKKRKQVLEFEIKKWIEESTYSFETDLNVKELIFCYSLLYKLGASSVADWFMKDFIFFKTGKII